MTSPPSPRSPRRVAVSGASGLLGAALTASLRRDGIDVRPLVRRRASSPSEISWDPDRATIDAAALEGLDAVVHLAGESVAHRWSTEHRRRIRESRVRGTELLTRTLASLTTPPTTLICASAIGFYGDRDEEALTEESPPGAGFLAGVVREWEAAATPAVQRGIRVVWTRFGILLSPNGGVLAKMLTPFRMGAGGKLGTGEQWFSWIDLSDAVRAIRFLLDRSDVSGVVNVTSPQPVTNAELTQALGDELHRPTVATVPAFALRLAMGREMADEMALVSQRVRPVVLERAGFEWKYPDIRSALAHQLTAPDA